MQIFDWTKITFHIYWTWWFWVLCNASNHKTLHNLCRSELYIFLLKPFNAKISVKLSLFTDPCTGVFHGTLSAEVRVKLGLICWQRDVSEKALEGSYQQDDVVKLENKKGTCLINETTAPQAQTDTYLALVQIVPPPPPLFLSPSLSICWSINQ